jgi:RNA polymerase sigma-70 factor (sigma-E family)
MSTSPGRPGGLRCNGSPRCGVSAGERRRQLLSAIGGDGFEDFVHAEIPRLLPLARLLARNGDDAADLVQETLIRVGLKWSSVRPDGNSHAYARTAMVRIHINAGRRRRREIVMDTPPQRVVDDPADSVADRDWMAGALRSLSPRQRAVVSLRYLEDLPMRDIAEALGCAEGTARSQLHRALASLRVTDADEISAAADADRREPAPTDGGRHAD